MCFWSYPNEKLGMIDFFTLPARLGFRHFNRRIVKGVIPTLRGSAIGSRPPTPLVHIIFTPVH